MGAGLPPHLIKQRVRRHLQKVARDNGGAYAKFAATGKSADGLAWTVTMGIARASNGESFGMEGTTVNGRFYPLSLAGALEAFRVEDGQEVQGEPGAYARLFQRQTFFQTWGRRYCVGLDIAGKGWRPGFILFDCVNGRALHIQDEEADRLAPRLFLAIRPHVREPEFKSGESLERLESVWLWKAKRADNLDSFCEAFADDSRWEASADWRAKPGNEYGAPSKKPFGLKEIPAIGAGPVALAYEVGEQEAADLMAEFAGAVTLVSFTDSDKIGETHGIALTGGGMNLADHLAIAYLCCGCVPPQRLLSQLPGVIDGYKLKTAGAALRKAYSEAAALYKRRADEMKRDSARVFAKKDKAA